MADTGLLAHEYEQSARIAREFTQAVLAVKKQHHRLPGAASLDPKEVAVQRKKLGELLSALEDALARKAGGPGGPGRPKAGIPYSLVQRVERSKRGVLPRFRQDLNVTASRLRSEVKALTQRDIQLLDELGQLLEAETSAAFRKLLRR